MLREEFERMTGFYPSADLYRVIEVRYKEFSGNKADFCKAYKSNAVSPLHEIGRRTSWAVCLNYRRWSVRQLISP